MKTKNRTKNKRKAMALQRPFSCQFCDNKEYHGHTLAELASKFPIK